MAEQPLKPTLQKPPGYKDPSAPAKPAPRPPVRKPVLPSSFQARRKGRGCRNICYRVLCIVFLILIVLLITAAGLFYLWFNPKPPVFHLLSLKISKFNVTQNTDGTYLNAVTLVRLEVRNPNGRLTYRYGQSEVDVTAGKDQYSTELGSVNLPKFTQGKKNTTSLKIQINLKNDLIADGVGKRLQIGFKRRLMVVNVELKTKVGLGVGRLKIGMLDVHVLCGGITLKELDGGQIPKCTINTLKWINIR